jgi:hypothetical protein
VFIACILCIPYAFLVCSYKGELTMEGNKKNLEENLANLLEQGELEERDSKKEALKKLVPPYESRIQVDKDPIREETKIIQKYITETNEKYLRYTREPGDEDPYKR